MRFLFLHTNFPAQFRHVARALAADPANRVWFATAGGSGEIPGVEKIPFKPHRAVRRDTHHYVRALEHAVLNGQAAYRAVERLRAAGEAPDVVVAHSGWGAGQFMKDAFPRARLLQYFEWYYHADGTDASFLGDPPLTVDDRLRIRAKNAPILLDLADCDWGQSPTFWQRSQFPAALRHKISVLHDGVDTAVLRPEPGARLHLPGLDLRHVDELVTYVARGMEPYRGFPQFLRAVERLQRDRPNAHVVVVGADRVAYGRQPPGGGSWKDTMLRELKLDHDRLHFTGLLPYDRYLAVLKASQVHVYLTVPFVLSWSMIEAMSAGCLVLGSDTQPVREVIEDGRNGLLVDFFDHDRIAARIGEVLDHRDRMAALRRQARETAVARYDLATLLPHQLRLIEDLGNGRLPPRLAKAPPAFAQPTRRIADAIATPARAAAAAG